MDKHDRMTVTKEGMKAEGIGQYLFIEIEQSEQAYSSKECQAHVQHYSYSLHH